MTSDPPPAIPAPAPRTSRATWLLAALAAAALAAGLGLLLTAGEGSVDLIRVSRFSMLPESFVGIPDYYAVVGFTTLDEKGATTDETQTTEVYDDTPIGNGLDFKLAKPLPLERITHIELLDEDMASDDTLDRVDVRDRVSRGQDYQFELLGQPDPRRQTAYIALGAGATLLVVAAILLIRSHAV